MRSRVLCLASATGAVIFLSTVSWAAPGGQQPAPRPPESSEARGPSRAATNHDAERTREELEKLLEHSYPGVGRVLKLDPSLMSNESYLAAYPALAEFLTQNPEISHSPSYYLQRYEGRWDMSDSPGMRIWNQIFNGLAGLTVLAVITGTIVWVIKTIVEYRRWQRVSKIQTDVHTKLLDRFSSSNEDLLSYIQTPAGSRFLESSPIPVQQLRPVGAPLSRILWSVQAGSVLAVAGLGLLLVSRSSSFAEEPAQALFAIAVLLLAVGVGFALSAAISLVLSRRLGLLEPPASTHA